MDFKKERPIKNIAAGLLDLVYPRLCILCRQSLPEIHDNNPICEPCRSLITANRPPFCEKCSRPLKSVEETYCAHCRQTPFYFDRSWASVIYDETMRRLIHLFKYGGKTSLRHTFGRMMTSFIRDYRVPVEQFDGVMPAPLHPVRLRERGYNQSRLLAETVCRDFGLTLVTDNLIRTRHTANQARLSPKERWTNIDGAFRIKKPERVEEKNILIIDDLFTTGSTASGIARALKEAGAINVSILTLAIAG